ncbi:fasciclin domain-containing protein [Streptomyces sp. NPDC054765]
MESNRIRHAIVAAAAALALPMSLGALAPQAFAGAATPSPSGSTPSSSASPSASVSPSASASPSASQPFGPVCSSLPKNGAGSVEEAAKQRLATAAANNPDLTTLVSALKKADLTDTLNNAKNKTLFAPTNEAFNKMGKAQVTALLNNKAELKKLLTYHVVDKEITPNELPHGSFTTLEGSKLTTSGSGTSFKVNNTVPISCGNITTANAKLYIIDGTLTPPGS